MGATFAPDPTVGVFNCSVVFANSSVVKCRTWPGQGCNLTFQVFTLSTDQSTLLPSNVGTDTFSYPAPVARTGSMRLRDGTCISAAATYHSDSNAYQCVSVELTYMALAPVNGLVQVTALQSGSALSVACDSLTLQYPSACFAAPYTTVSCCLPQSAGGTTFSLSFAVGPLATSSANAYQHSVSDSDKFVFALTPIVYAVSGCPYPMAPNGTSGCPTNGTNVLLTITGSSFQTESVFATVDGNDCVIPSRTSAYVTTTSLICALPVGAGLLRSVLVYQNSKFSNAVPYLSYALPTIERLLSAFCNATADGSVGLVNCPRGGNVVLTVQGQNFGASGAKVVVAGQVSGLCASRRER